MSLIELSPLTTFGTGVVLFVYMVFVALVGKARAGADLKPPAMSGNLAYECANRVHLNTLEQMAVFLPALWLARGVGAADFTTGVVALAWAGARIAYAATYPGPLRAVGAVPSVLLSGSLVGFVLYSTYASALAAF